MRCKQVTQPLRRGARCWTLAFPRRSRSGTSFYVSGGTGANPEEAVHASLTYFPTRRFLGSGLLQGIKMEVTCEGGDHYFYDYALMFGAAAMLARFALHKLGLPYALVVGFDSGDIVRIT